jgi:hypothetical protein
MLLWAGAVSIQRLETSLGNQAPAIDSKQKLIDSTTTAWNTLVTYVDGLAVEQWTGPTDAAGWTVKDHVSHLTEWDRAMIALLRTQVPLKETLGISDTAWSAGSYDPMNEEIRQFTVNEPVSQVKAERDVTWTDLVSLMDQLSEAQLARPGAAVGLAVGTRPLNDAVHAQSVMQVLVEWCGGSYAEHLRYVKSLVEGESGTQSR